VKNCKIYDARGYYAALGNMFAGKGYEKPEFYTNCDIEWLNIPNIHAVRDSFNTMMNYRHDNQGSNFLALCAQTGWYDYLYLILAGAKSIAQDLLNGLNVVVHCSDGWDRTSQLSALSQLIIDPYYRTI
jgi:protein tyrosine/serine phosphatase